MNWKSENLELAFISCPREPFMLNDTLNSAFKDNDYFHAVKSSKVMMDAPNFDPSSLNKKFVGLNWHTQTAEQIACAAKYPVRQRGVLNYSRALEVSEGTRGLVLFEDDLSFRENWLDLLLQTLNEMGDLSHCSILSLYSSYNNLPKAGEFYSKYQPPHTFFGTQGMFFPVEILQALKKEIVRYGFEENTPYDLAMGWFVRRSLDWRLYATVCSLVQHVGCKSTGLAKFMHTSPTFDLSWPSN